MRSDPRRNALDALNALDEGRFHLDYIIQELFNPDVRPMDRRDRALFTTLVFGVTRWRGRLDWVIHQFSRFPLKKIRPEVQNILRMALFQILFLDRIPASAAVNTAVELAKMSAAAWTVRFVNGLLRNVIRNPNALEFPSPETDPITFLAVSRSFPDWLVRRWMDRFGFNETADLCDFVNHIPPLTIRTNTLRIQRNDLATRLASNAGNIVFTDVSPDGLRLTTLNMPLDQMQAFADGLFQVQDEAAQLISLLLNPGSGETVLDACAGFGGKTAHMAQLMNNSGHIKAIDRDSKKIKQLEEDMKRMGISNVIGMTGDLEMPAGLADDDSFDRILLDAPCSGLGVIRRNPDIKWDPSRRDLIRFAARQAMLLQNIASFLKPSGRMVYAVCSTEPEETDAVVFSFLDRNPDFKTVTDLSYLPGPVRLLTDKNGFLRTFPHRHAMDGFFASCLEKCA